MSNELLKLAVRLTIEMSMIRVHSVQVVDETHLMIDFDNGEKNFLMFLLAWKKEFLKSSKIMDILNKLGFLVELSFGQMNKISVQIHCI